jgi:hypothetical protein
MARPLRLEFEGAIYHLLGRDYSTAAQRIRWINKADSAGLKKTRREMSNV